MDEAQNQRCALLDLPRGAPTNRAAARFRYLELTLYAKLKNNTIFSL